MHPTITIPGPVARILERLQACGFEAYAVGGCIRDSLLGRIPEDWDITTSAKPDQVKEIFGRTIDTGIQHGTVTVLVDHIGYEITTYRVDGEYEDGRHPKSVEYTSDLLKDLKRRDFTINAMAYSPSAGLVDAFDGIRDLREHMIRCVGDPAARFHEDALRLLRAVRFSAQLGFEVETRTRQAIIDTAPDISKVSKERIQAEMNKLLLSGSPERVAMVGALGLAPYLTGHFSQIDCSRSAFTSRIPAVKHMRWSAFLRREEAGDAALILRELKMDNNTVDKVKTLVGLWRSDLPSDRPGIRRLMSGMKPELFDDLLDFQELFRVEDLTEVRRARELAGQIREAGDCVSLKTMAVTGRDLIAMGVKPGPVLGGVLDHLFQRVLDEPKCNDREYLLGLAKELERGGDGR